MIILASKSPRRKELMKKFITSSFIVEASNQEEIIDYSLSPKEIAMSIAKQKGMNVYCKHHDDIIISCDTIVVYKNKIYGKPKDFDEALKMLSNLNGKNHEVISGYFIKSNKIEILNYDSSIVKLKTVSQETLTSYINNNKPYDKAGSYGIQEDYFKENILSTYSGSINNIIGFPIEKILKDLTKNDLL